MHFYHILHLTGDQFGFYELEVPVTREELKSFWSGLPQSPHVSSSGNPEARKDKAELRDLTLFRSSQEVVITNSSLNRNASVCLIEAAGNMDLILPDTLMLGSLPSPDDSRGCAVSRKTAETLYSSREVLGETLYYEETPYFIRGILDIGEELCLIQGPGEAGYPNLLAHAPGLPLSVVRQQLSGLLSGEIPVLSEGNLYMGLGSIFLWLPAWPFLYYLLRLAAQGGLLLKSRLSKRSWMPFVSQLLPYLLPVLGFAGVCLILLGCLHFSDDYVPTAWSDFEFWTELFSGKARQLQALVSSSLSYEDLRALSSLAGLFVASLAEALLLPLLCRAVFPGSASLESEAD